MNPQEALERLLPMSVRSVVDKFLKNRDEQLFTKTDPNLQMVIIILQGKGESLENRGRPIMDRYQKPPLPSNPFQI